MNNEWEMEMEMEGMCNKRVSHLLSPLALPFASFQLQTKNPPLDKMEGKKPPAPAAAAEAEDPEATPRLQCHPSPHISKSM